MAGVEEYGNTLEKNSREVITLPPSSQSLTPSAPGLILGVNLIRASKEIS